VTLSQFIVANMEAILKEWESYAKTIAAAAEMDTAALRNDAEKILKTIAAEMEALQSDEEQMSKSRGKASPSTDATAAEGHAVGRQAEGFSVNEMVSEYRALRASVIRLWTRDMSSADRDTLYQLTRFNEGMDQALTESIAAYSKRLDRSRELFLGVLGHDLRTPIGALLNSTQYLLSSDGLSGAQTEAASVIWRSGTRLRNTVLDLLDVARTRLGQSLPIAPKPVDLTAICEHVVSEAQAHHPEHTVRLSVSGDLSGSWDEARIGQMLSNLLENGIRHGAAAKPVTASANGGAADHVTLSVHNEGTPIPESAHRRIFEPLTQEEHNPADHQKAGGLGLGLYIACEIAKAHGGTIDLESTPEKGTIFSVQLPRDARVRGTP
jgi:signal transduction histidine kinase